MPDCLIKLRDATRPIHQSVEVITDSEQLLGENPNLAHYQQFLSAHYLLHHQVERHCSRAGQAKASVESAALLNWPIGPRITALSSDLSRFGITIEPSDYADLAYQSVGFSLGLVYVCEGSCIGNQRVLAALSRHDDFHQWDSKAFLSGSKLGFADRWKALLSLIERLSANSTEPNGSCYEELELGAIAGFKVYIEYWQALEYLTRDAEAVKAAN